MDVELLMLADGAVNRPDGKLDIYGAGFDTVFAQAVPAVHPQLSVIVRVRLQPHELEAEHQIGVLVIGPDAEVARLEGRLEVPTDEAREKLPATRTAAVPFVLNVGSITFPVHGDYAIALTWDNNEVKRIPLYVVDELPAPPAG